MVREIVITDEFKGVQGQFRINLDEPIADELIRVIKENCLVLQCNQCKMVYGHQYNIGLYELNQSEKDNLNESES